MPEENEIQTWNGEGLPPAGTTCLTKRTGAAERHWRKVLVLCVGEQRIFYRDPDGDELSRTHGEMDWAPIRTPEQTERDKCMTLWLQAVATDYDQATADKCEKILIDAGYRKQVAP
ncbi:hypothetical protein EMIT048CA2_140155 [Pseudomonas chlororaphis]|uniref:hypothetical protein n=1 Tax=Pseudomonas chlororaphis TaxID=587753 RepID=UPI0039DFFD56